MAQVSTRSQATVSDQRAYIAPTASVIFIAKDTSPASVAQLALSRAGYASIVVSKARDALRHIDMNGPPVAAVVWDAEGFQGASRDGVTELRAAVARRELPTLYLGHRPVWEEMSAREMLLAKPVHARDIVALVKVLAAPVTNGAITVDCAELPIAQLVRALVAARTPAVVSRPDGLARVIVGVGQVTHVEFQRRVLLANNDTLARILCIWGHAADVRLESAPELSAGRGVAIRDLTKVVFPRILQFDEAARTAPLLTERLEVRIARLGENLRRLPDELNAVIRLCDGHRTVSEVLFQAPFPESLTTKALEKLVRLGVLAPLDSGGRESASASLQELSSGAVARTQRELGELFAGSAATRHRGTDTPPQEPLEESWLDVAEGTHDVRVGEGLHSISAAEEQFFSEPPPQPNLADEMSAVSDVDVAASETSPAGPGRPYTSLKWKLAIVAAVICGASLSIAMVVGRELRSGSQSPREPQANHREVVSNASPTVVQTADVSANVARAVEEAKGDEAFETAAAFVAASDAYERGDARSARTILEELVGRDQAPAESWLLLGLTRFETGDVQGAQEAAETMIALDNNHPRAHVLLATILIESGRRQQAKAELRKYLALDPTGVHAEEARAILASP